MSRVGVDAVPAALIMKPLLVFAAFGVRALQLVEAEPEQLPATHAPPLPTTQSPLTGASPAGEFVALLRTMSVDAGHVTPLPVLTATPFTYKAAALRLPEPSAPPAGEPIVAPPEAASTNSEQAIV